MTYVLAKDLHFADIEFTYENDDGTHRSWLDHVLVSSNVLHRIHRIYTLCDGANLSDYRPLCVELHWTSSPSLVSSHYSHLSSNRLAWYKATYKQIHACKSLVTESCRTIKIPNEVLNIVLILTAWYITPFLSNYVHNWSIAKWLAQIKTFPNVLVSI